MTSRRHRVRALAAAACVVASFVARPAAGQGAEMLPDPISSRELSVYAKRLELMTMQREALTSAHDQYRREYAALREGDVADFLEELAELQRTGMMPSLEQVDKVLAGWRDLLKRIETIDEQFFARLEPMLDDVQKATLPRLRLLRERARYKGGRLGDITGRMPMDLSDLFVTLDMPEDVRLQVDPAVAAYEQNLTRQLRKLGGHGRRSTRSRLSSESTRR